MSRVTYQYTVLRYMPDFMSGESLNVGVVVHSPKEKRLVVRTSPGFKRVTAAFPQTRVGAVHFAVSAIEAGLRSFFESNPEQTLETALREVMLDDSAAMQHSSIGVGASVSLESAAEELLQRFVTKWEETRYFDAPLIVAETIRTMWIHHLGQTVGRRVPKETWDRQVPSCTNDPVYAMGDDVMLAVVGR